MESQPNQETKRTPKISRKLDYLVIFLGFFFGLIIIGTISSLNQPQTQLILNSFSTNISPQSSAPGNEGYYYVYAINLSVYTKSYLEFNYSSNETLSVYIVPSYALLSSYSDGMYAINLDNYAPVAYGPKSSINTLMNPGSYDILFANNNNETASLFVSNVYAKK